MAKTVARREVLRSGVAGAGVWLAGLRIDELMKAVPSVSGQPFKAGAKERPGTSDDLAYLTIAEAAELIRMRRLSPVELVDACLDRIERHDKVIQAWVTVLPDEARAEAKAAANQIARRGPRSPLHGIPIGHKDLYDMKGVRTTAGSKVRADAPPAKQDSAVVARLRAAGAIALGKTNTHEFAYGVRTPPHIEPVGLCPHPGRIERGNSRGAGGGDVPGREWLRYRRIDPDPIVTVQHSGDQADVRASQQGRPSSLGVERGPCRADGSISRGLRANAQLDGRSRRPRPHDRVCSNPRLHSGSR